MSGEITKKLKLVPGPIASSVAIKVMNEPCYIVDRYALKMRNDKTSASIDLPIPVLVLAVSRSNLSIFNLCLLD